MRNISYCLALASLCAPQIVIAQDAQGRPDDKVSWKYFYFHKPDVSQEQARADIVECYTFSQNLTLMQPGSVPTYTSVPYGGTTGISPATAALAGAAGSLVGAIVLGFMNAGERRAMERTNLRKCFGFKEYHRYELTKEEHKALHEGEPEVVRTRLIEKATGPKPQAERLVS